MKKRILSMLLALVMVISLIPVSTYAAAQDTVYISVSLDGAYLTAGTGTYKGKPMAYLPVTLKVLKNTVKLESFGLSSYVYDADGDGTEDITALHLLIYAHEKIYGTKWKNNVTVSGDPGSLTIQNGLFGFTDNKACYLNGTADLSVAADHVVLKSGDFLDVAGYTGGDFTTKPSAGFRYFVDDQNNITHKFTGKLNESLTVSLIPAAANTLFYSRTFLDSNAKTATTDADGKAVITPDSCGTWYVWSLGDGASAPAYAEIFVPWENTDHVTAYWANFRNSQYNMAITDAKTPVSAATTVEKWAVSKGTSWTDTPSGMIIADNALIFMGQTTITKADLQTGEVLATNKMSGSSGFAIISPTFGDGLIFCPQSGGKIEAFNAKNLDSVWLFTDALGGQNNTPITYYDGYVYTGYWNAENKDGNFVCVSAATGELVWSKTTLGGHYWSGAVVIGNAVIFGSDDGASSWEGDSHLYALNRLTGEVISDIALTGMGDQRSTIAYSPEKGRVYFTTKNGYIASAAVDAATGALSDLKSNKIASQATATPVVYGDKIYVGAGGGMQVGATAGNLFAVDADTLEYLYEVPLKGYPQGSILISTAYLEETGKLYCYSTYNSQPGGMTLIKIDPNATTADGVQVEEIYDATNHPQYCLISPICGPDGTIYYRNDSATLIALTTNNAYLTGLTASVGTFEEEFKSNLHNYALTVPVGTTSVTLTPTAGEGGVTEAVTVTLVDGAATATITVTKGSESRTYTVNVRMVSTDASLSILKVNQTNSYGTAVSNVSPDFSSNQHYYSYLTAGSSRAFMNVWADATNGKATVKIFPMDNAQGKNDKEINEDGSMKVTAVSNKHDRYAVYFTNGAKPMAVRIEVTSENGEKDNYYLVISKEAAAEESKALLEKIKADKTVADKAAADAVAEKIAAIGTVTLDSKTTIEAARTAYNALTVGQRTLVNNYNILTTAEDSLEALQDAADKAAADQAVADAVSAKISALGTVTLDSKTAIEAARTAYDGLTTEQKALVTNLDTLTAAEASLKALQDATDKAAADLAAADAVSAKISALGTVTLDSKTAIEAARAAYDALTAEQKALVTNLDTLTAAEASLKALQDVTDKAAADQAAADAVSAKISALGTVTLDSKTAIEAARAAYDGLTAEQKALVTNLDTLTAAEASLKALQDVTDKATADQATADAVSAKISALGTVTLDSKTAIEAARAAYDALTAEQKTLVTNYNVLTAAEKALSTLVSDNPKTGDNTDFVLYTTIMLVSFMGIAVVLLTSWKKYKYE